MHPALPKSYKGSFSFKIGTTSFIYPAGYVQNVRMLAPYLDEIELLLFESAPEGLPSTHKVEQLFNVSNEFDLTYNIHLPLDIFLGAPERSIRQFALETVIRIMDLTASLSPSTYTLHLPYDEAGFDNEQVKRWRDRLDESMKKLVSAGISGDMISIETLDYPMDWLEDILVDFNLSVCIDVGHLMLFGFDLDAVFNKHKKRTSILHLHGVDNQKDHLPLDRLTKENAETVIRMLKQYEGVVSLEVFSFDHLKASLNFLDNHRDMFLTNRS
jgi:sugar phosphate isomerase/epimerase